MDEVQQLPALNSPVTGLAASLGSITAEPELKKERSDFFQRSESSSVPVTQPAGCGGERDGFAKT